MSDTEAVARWESSVIIQLHKLAEIQRTLLTQLVAGRVHSEVTYAYKALHNAASAIERLSKEVPP